MKEDPRSDLDHLKELVAFLDEHPALLEYGLGPVLVQISQKLGGDEFERLATCAREFGSAEKSTTESYFWLTKRFGPHKLSVAAPREQVCEKVTKIELVEVTERVGEDMRPIVTRQVERETAEWVCPDSILEKVQR